jgi:tRNA G10  N-methylase Trm11
MYNSKKDWIERYIAENKVTHLSDLTKHFIYDLDALYEISSNPLYYTLLLDNQKYKTPALMQAGEGKWLQQHSDNFSEEIQIIMKEN